MQRREKSAAVFEVRYNDYGKSITAGDGGCWKQDCWYKEQMGTEDVKVGNTLFEKLDCEGNLREKIVVAGGVFLV